MTTPLANSMFVLFSIMIAFGYLIGYGVARQKNRFIQAKLIVAEAAVIQKQGQLNQAQKRIEYLEQYKTQVDREFDEGRYEIV